MCVKLDFCLLFYLINWAFLIVLTNQVLGEITGNPADKQELCWQAHEESRHLDNYFFPPGKFFQAPRTMELSLGQLKSPWMAGSD